MEHLQNFINECDRRTEQAKRRLAETQEELSSEVAAKLNRVHELAEQIGKKLAEAEKLGAEGNVEDSLKLMEEVEASRQQKSMAEQEYRNSMPASSYQQQKLRVCEVCSAYLGIHDNDRRLADHFGGKLHLGFITIRERLDELKAKVTDTMKRQYIASVAEIMKRQYIKIVNERSEKPRSDRDADKDERDWKSKWPSRSRSRSLTRRRRSRSRSQERRHYRSRSRSRSPHRSRNSDAHQSRSRDGKRKRNHSRDRSRERKHHRSSDRHKMGRHSRDKDRTSDRNSGKDGRY